jgi:hypothetical protein
MPDSDSSSGSKQPSAHEPVQNDDTIVLEDTASTNFAARKIVLNRNGEVDITSGASSSGDSESEPASSNHYEIDVAVASRIFSGLDKMWPLHPGKQSRYKSISFGHCSYLTYKGERSPDLDSCMNAPEVNELVSDLNVLRALEPNKQH